MEKKLLLILACILILTIATPALAAPTIDSSTSAEEVKYSPGIERLNPNGAGSQTQIDNQYPDSGYHWQKVSGSGYVWMTADQPGADPPKRDLYALPDSSPLGVISKVTVYCSAYQTEDPANYGMFYPSLRTHGVTYDGPLKFLTGSSQTNSYERTTNPNTGLAWTWDEISALQAGVKLNVGLGSWRGQLRCTTVYVDVDYTAPIAPTVTTQAASSIMDTTARCNGTVTDTGYEDPTVTVYWGDNDGVTTPGNWDFSSVPTSPSQPQGAATFYKDVNSLNTGTLYYFSAKATNAGGTGWGTTKSLYTLPGNPSSLAATANSSSQIDLTWTKGTGGDKTMIRRKAGSYPTSVSDGDQAYFDTGTSYSDTGRSPGTSYYYRAYAYDSVGGQYSSGYSQDYATTDCVAPSITTDAATSVAFTTARLNSTLTNDGGEACEVRFQYNTTENWTTCDNTTWVAGYTTGQHPYTDLEDLVHNTLYYFRAQAKNSISTDNGTALTFTTSNAVLTPTNFKAYPEAERIPLSWFKGSGSTFTHVRVKEGLYPTTVTDGTQVYNEALSSTAAEDLTPGTTYYFSAWGLSGTTYSDNYTTVMATTLAMEADVETPDAPGDLPTWFQSPDYTRLSGLPGYELINRWPDSANIPRATFWTFWILLMCILAGAIVFAATGRKHPIPAVITIGFVMSVFLAMEQLPLWMIVFVVMDIAGALALGSKH